MVFLIQATQIKLDEIIRAIGHARNELLDIEELEEADLNQMRKDYEALAEKARAMRERSR